MAAGTIISVIGGIQSGAYNEEMAKFNAQQLDAQAADAIARGETEAAKVGVEAKRMIGAQRASLAGQGIEVGSGTAAALQVDTVVQSAHDENQIRVNAMRQAYGLGMEASATRTQGRMAGKAATYQAAGGLLTGGAQAIDMARRGDSGLMSGLSTSDGKGGTVNLFSGKQTRKAD